MDVPPPPPQPPLPSQFSQSPPPLPGEPPGFAPPPPPLGSEAPFGGAGYVADPAAAAAAGWGNAGAASSALDQMSADQYAGLTPEQQAAMWQQWEAAQAGQYGSYYQQQPAAPMPDQHVAAMPGIYAQSTSATAPYGQLYPVAYDAYGTPIPQQAAPYPAIAPYSHAPPPLAVPVHGHHMGGPGMITMGGGMPVIGPDGTLFMQQPKKAVPDWLQQEILKRKAEADRKAAHEAARKARRLRGSDSEDPSGSDEDEEEEGGGKSSHVDAQRRTSGGGSRWGGHEGASPASAAKDGAGSGRSSEDEEDAEPEEDEATRRVKLNLEVKRHLGGVLVEVTDALLDDIAREMVQGGGQQKRQRQPKAGAVKVLGAGLVTESGSGSNNSEGGSGGGGGGVLLGLAYGSEEEEEAEGQQQQKAALVPKQQQQKWQQQSSDSGEAMLEDSGDEQPAVQAVAVEFRPHATAPPSPTAAVGPTPPPRFAKGNTVHYIERSGQRNRATVMSVDISIHPPSYVVRIHALETMRETEEHRLEAIGEAEPAAGGEAAAAPAVLPAAPSQQQMLDVAPPQQQPAPDRAGGDEQALELRDSKRSREHKSNCSRSRSRGRDREKRRSSSRSRSRSRDREKRHSSSRNTDQDRRKRGRRGRSRSREHGRRDWSKSPRWRHLSRSRSRSGGRSGRRNPS